jgi:pimeloyl-ACP methyl ester carboxylesterase
VTSQARVLADTIRAPWQLAAPWGAQGYVSALDGWMHWVEFESGSAAGPPLVFVHGLGGSHLNWALVGPQLAAGRRAMALDLRGFGLTPGDRRTATIWGNIALLRQFIDHIAGEPVILIGNSMGGMLSILQAHTHPDSVAGLVLIAPVLPARVQRPDLRAAGQFWRSAVPGLRHASVRALRDGVPPRYLVKRVIDLYCTDPVSAGAEIIEASTALSELHRATTRGTDEALVVAARSLMNVASQPRRYEAVMAALGLPVLLIGGTRDPVVPLASIRAAAASHPGWRTVIMEDVGHTPQLEKPQAVVPIVQDWLDRHFPSSDAWE